MWWFTHFYLLFEICSALFIICSMHLFFTVGARALLWVASRGRAPWNGWCPQDEWNSGVNPNLFLGEGTPPPRRLGFCAFAQCPTRGLGWWLEGLDRRYWSRDFSFVHITAKQRICASNLFNRRSEDVMRNNRILGVFILKIHFCTRTIYWHHTCRGDGSRTLSIASGR